VYFDTCYIAKFYFNEPGSSPVRERIRAAGSIHSSLWAFAEFHAVVHRRLRERSVSPANARALVSLFTEHVESGFWHLAPVSESLLRKTSALTLAAPRNLFLRTADAVHLATAQHLGELEIWTNDRHMLAAAPYFGLTGRSV
jgi:predicted nucleic acid-binding protein